MTITRRTMLALTAGAAASPRLANAASGTVPEKAPWWQDSVFYEIYPRSFQDGNGDGIGDFIGMGDRVDHLVDLGVDAVWVAACFDSPNADNGYDVRDYRKIMPDFGTMQDFEYFLGRAKKRGIRVILDMVFNHTSDEHPWFVQSRSSRDNPYRDFYHWHDGHDNGPPTNWPSAFGGPAWTLDPRTGQYYLHTFVAKQPDLNWENPKVRDELYAILKFWTDKGVDGFRFDAITSIAKPAKLQDLSAQDLAAGHPFAEHGKRLNSYLHDMNMHCFAGTDLYAVGETWGADHTLFMAIADARRHELSSGFRFDFQMKDIQSNWRKLPFRLEDLRAFNADNAFDDHPTTWPVVWLEDHDFPRSASRFGSQRPEFQTRSAKLLATMILSLRGTPFIYQGQEIGMRNYPFTSIEQFNDVTAHNAWAEQVGGQKMSPAEMLANLTASTRDNARTPMQWSMAHNAGFSTGKPWMPVNPDYRTINVVAESHDPNSVLAYYKAMIAVRKAHPALVHGRYRDVSPDSSTIYAYRRDHASGNMLVIMNFSDSEADFPIPHKVEPGKILISNMPGKIITSPNLTLAPWESVIVTI
jgi:oligo-1,6-glucosidase